MQIVFRLAASGGTTAQIESAATTSGPIKIPSWAPDIAYIPTTTVDEHAAIITPTTTNGAPVTGQNPNINYNRRCFGVKNIHYENAFAAGNTIILRYVAVGELTRS